MEAGGLMAGRGDGQRTARHGMIEDCEANERTTQRVDAGGDSRSRSGTRAAGEGAQRVKGEQPVHGDHPAYDKAGLEAASDRRTTQRMTSGRSAWHRTACGSLHRGHLTTTTAASMAPRALKLHRRVCSPARHGSHTNHKTQMGSRRGHIAGAAHHPNGAPAFRAAQHCAPPPPRVAGQVR
jgi:hypothetical protein